MLSDDTWHDVASFLDFRDLVTLTYVSKNVNIASKLVLRAICPKDLRVMYVVGINVCFLRTMSGDPKLLRYGNLGRRTKYRVFYTDDGQKFMIHRSEHGYKECSANNKNMGTYRLLKGTFVSDLSDIPQASTCSMTKLGDCITISLIHQCRYRSYIYYPRKIVRDVIHGNLITLDGRKFDVQAWLMLGSTKQPCLTYILGDTSEWRIDSSNPECMNIIKFDMSRTKKFTFFAYLEN